MPTASISTGLLQLLRLRRFASLPHRGRIRIDVRLDPMLVIPETGVAGFTDESGDVRIAIDVERRDLRESLETWVPAMVAHELHHSSRIRTGPGYGATLGEALVSEGLADHFASQVFPHTPPQPWDHALTNSQEHALWRLARRELNVRTYNHFEWFLGGGSIAHWAGYTLGYDIVGRYLREHHQSASDAVAVSAAKVISSFRSS
jgi:hypothetical protein